MNVKRSSRRSRRNEAKRKFSDRARRVAAASATTIVALQGTAFARQTGTAHPQTEIFQAPFLGPAALAALGGAIATIGAYRLMRDRRRGDPSAED